MTRGTLFYYESDTEIWSSTEFNGDMYHGTPEEPQGEGDKVIKLMTGLKNLDDFRNVLKEINKDYNYDEGGDCWLISDEAIAKVIKRDIEWIEKDRPDLKGNKDFDPRAMERIPTFKDVRTWHFWGTPNLSDYSYIYNNSGKDLLITTNSQTPGMIIPDGAVGVLNYGSNDSIFKDGKLIDGMGNYKESKATYEKPVLKKIRALAEFKYGNKNLSITVMPDDIWEVVKECPKTLVIKRNFVELRIDKPQPNKIWEFIYE